MKDYASMSDREINMHVASIIYPESTGIESKSRPPCACVTGRIPNCWVDYCNNPAEAWPIIVESGITLAFQDGNWWADNLAYWVDGVEWNIGGIVDKNPLRAAMIVFLMMKEGEK